jgi:hypothetical protein
MTSRNIAGGFLGGTLGILVSWFVAPIALPVGVLLGVVVGYWAENIATMFIRSCQTAARFWNKCRKVPGTSYHTASRPFRGVIPALRKALRGTQYITLLPIAAFLLPAALFRRFREWATHPANTALLISISALVVGTGVSTLLFYTLCPWPETETLKSGEIVPLGLLPKLVVTSFATFILMMFGMGGFIRENDVDSPTRNFYGRWERYAKLSPITHFARELYRFFRSQLIFGTFFVLMIFYWLTLGGLMIALVVIPVITFVSFMVGLYKIAQQPGHWWCFGVTLVVTSISALAFYSTFSNGVMLWMVALSAGTTSGILTECLRRLGLWWSRTTMGQYYLTIWYDDQKALPFSIAVPVWCAIGRTCEAANDRVQRAIG